MNYWDDYARSLVKNQIWYLDSDAAIVTRAAFATNPAIKQCGLLSNGRNQLKLSFPIRYSNNYLTNVNFCLQCSLSFMCSKMITNKTIFQKDGTGRRIVVRKFELWVPKLMLSSEGQKMDWRYLKDRNAAQQH